MSQNLLTIRNLNVEYAVKAGRFRAIRNLSLDVYRGEVLGVIGESGCGKSTLGKALLRLLPSNGFARADEFRYGSVDLLRISEKELRKLRWQQMALISQSAMNALNPVFRVGDQIAEAIYLHRPVSKQQAWLRAGELLEEVGIPKKWRSSYPHELSGGMRQRVCIAMALALQPEWIVADEPTTALDVVTQKHILQLLKKMQQERRMSVILISHDIGVIAETCDRVAVMYAGMIVELGTVQQVIEQSAHPYTIGLKNAFPNLLEERELISIPGHPPNLQYPPPGCSFAPRCPFEQPICRQGVPDLLPVSATDEPIHQAACYFASDQAEQFRQRGVQKGAWAQGAKMA